MDVIVYTSCRLRALLRAEDIAAEKFRRAFESKQDKSPESGVRQKGPQEFPKKRADLRAGK